MTKHSGTLRYGNCLELTGFCVEKGYAHDHLYVKAQLLTVIHSCKCFLCECIVEAQRQRQQIIVVIICIVHIPMLFICEVVFCI
jgi:hypothetical protein